MPFKKVQKIGVQLKQVKGTATEASPQIGRLVGAVSHVNLNIIRVALDVPLSTLFYYPVA